MGANVVAALHRDIHDPDLGVSSTIKVNQSQKRKAADRDWEHAWISLKPDSNDGRFVALEFGPGAEGHLSIVAEFIAAL
jgi:hypothetical protein